MNQSLQTTEPVTALVTLDPENYATAVYEPFKARLETAIANAKGVTYDIQTKEGMAVAIEHRAVLRAIRIDADKERAARKAPIIAIGKLLESKYTEIEAEITPYEDKFHADIKAEEERIKAEKAAKIKAEEEAKAAIQNKIDAIKNKPLEVMNKSLAEVEAAIDELSPIIPTPAEFGERYIEAEYAIKASIDTLKNILDGKKAQAQLEAQNKAAQEQREAEEKERARVDGIKAKIQNIKNFIITASECETSKEIEALIDVVNSMPIISIEYQEFESEALEAKTKTIQSLNRQLKILADFENENTKNQANVNVAISGDVVYDGNQVVEAAFVDAVTTGTGVMSVSVDNEKVSTKHIPVAQTRNPTRRQLIEGISSHFSVNDAVAERWLVTEFGSVKQAA